MAIESGKELIVEEVVSLKTRHDWELDTFCGNRLI